MLYCDTGETRLREAGAGYDDAARDAIGGAGMNHKRERVRRGAILELFTFVHDF